MERLISDIKDYFSKTWVFVYITSSPTMMKLFKGSLCKYITYILSERYVEIKLYNINL